MEWLGSPANASKVVFPTTVVARFPEGRACQSPGLVSASSTTETLLGFWLGLFPELIHGWLAAGASDPTDVLAGGFTGQ